MGMLHGLLRPRSRAGQLDAETLGKPQRRLRASDDKALADQTQPRSIYHAVTRDRFDDLGYDNACKQYSIHG
jgi:hypothetical protein